jgi:NMD protein affecting ribosome stability and mRNA decay
MVRQGWDFHYRPKKIIVHDLKLEVDEDGNPSTITGIVDISASPDAFVPLITISKQFEILIEFGECTECRTRLTGSYSSKIQIRSSRKVNSTHLEEWGAEIESISREYPLSDGKNPLFEIKILKSGIDAFFQARASANTVGRLFAKNNGGVVSMTTEFAGYDQSKSREYPRKPVVLINLPEFTEGDIVVINNHYPLQIASFRNKKVEFWDFTRKKWRKLPLKSFLTSRPKLLELDHNKYQIVNFEQEGAIAQIMNMNSFEIRYIDATEIADLSEGMTFEGMFFNDILLRRQKKGL